MTTSRTTLSHHDRENTAFPFGFAEAEFVVEQRLRDVRDTLIEVLANESALVESLAFERLEHAEAGDATHGYLSRQLPVMLDDLERRRRLVDVYRNDPLNPGWPRIDRARFQARIDAVRATWSCERLARELLLCDLVPAGKDELKAVCPLPGCPSSNPHFYINTKKNCWHCWSCERGGEAIKLAQYALNLSRFTDALRALERESGVQR